MLWFKFVLGLNLISFCPKLIIIHYHTPKQKKIKFKQGIKLNHHSYIIMQSKQKLHYKTPAHKSYAGTSRRVEERLNNSG